MFCRKLSFIVRVFGLVVVPAAAAGAIFVWPDLPKDCFVSNRPANTSDVQKGCAVFMFGETGTSAGTPLSIDIPQYAWHVDQESGKKAPVILIQAGESSGIKTVGYNELDSPSLGAALLSEMILLGRRKPRQ